MYHTYLVCDIGIFMRSLQSMTSDAVFDLSPQFSCCSLSFLKTRSLRKLRYKVSTFTRGTTLNVNYFEGPY